MAKQKYSEEELREIATGAINIWKKKVNGYHDLDRTEFAKCAKEFCSKRYSPTDSRYDFRYTDSNKEIPRKALEAYCEECRKYSLLNAKMPSQKGLFSGHTIDYWIEKFGGKLEELVRLMATEQKDLENRFISLKIAYEETEKAYEELVKDKNMSAKKEQRSESAKKTIANLKMENDKLRAELDKINLRAQKRVLVDLHRLHEPVLKDDLIDKCTYLGRKD